MDDHKNYNCRVTFDDGKEVNVYANWMYNSNLNYWKGWLCNAGVTRIFIDANLDVYDGECLNSKLGNLKTGWELYTNKVECRQVRCTGCTDDLMVEKQEKV